MHLFLRHIWNYLNDFYVHISKVHLIFRNSYFSDSGCMLVVHINYKLVWKKNNIFPVCLLEYIYTLFECGGFYH